MIDMLKAARAAKQEIAGLGTEEKNLALNSMADALVEARDEILAANKIDIEKAQGIISPVMIDRLMLNSARIFFGTASLCSNFRYICAIAQVEKMQMFISNELKAGYPKRDT